MTEFNENKPYSLWDIITYLSEEEFLPVLKERGIRYAYIYHDRDVKESGEIKEPHWHILLTVKGSTTFGALLQHFKRAGEANTRLLPITRDYIADRFRYLTHKSNPEKYQYDAQAIRTNDLEYYQGTINRYERQAAKEEANEALVADLLGDEFSIRSMALKYGRDFIVHMKQYVTFRALVLRGEVMQELNSACVDDVNKCSAVLTEDEI